MNVSVVEETCAAQGCGVVFWITQGLESRLVKTKERFYCPCGHGMSYQGQSDAQKMSELRREILNKDREIAGLNIELQMKSKPKAKKKKQ